MNDQEKWSIYNLMIACGSDEIGVLRAGLFIASLLWLDWKGAVKFKVVTHKENERKRLKWSET